MIPNAGCDPKINIVTIGAEILVRLRKGSIDISELLLNCAAELNVSVDHIILAIDWLYIISAVRVEGERVDLYETK